MKHITSVQWANETVQFNNLSVRYVIPDWEALILIGSQSEYLNITKNPTQGNRFNIGGMMREARNLQIGAIAAFQAMAPQLDKIQRNPDYTRQAKERLAGELMEALLPQLNTEEMDKKLSSLFQIMRDGVFPVLPNPVGDVIAEMRDQEIRGFLANMKPDDKKVVFAEMINGEHPELVAAAMRGSSPITSGMKPSDIKRLTGAAIAGKYSEDLHFALELIYITNVVRVTALRVFESLLTICNLRALPKFARMTDKAFPQNQELAEFREWCRSFPLLKKEKSGTEKEQDAKSHPGDVVDDEAPKVA